MAVRELDERWLADYIQWGITRLEKLLADYAAFTEYLTTHPPKEKQ